MTTRLIVGSLVFGAMILASLGGWAEEPFGPVLKPDRFSLLRQGERAVLGAELLAGVYGPKDTMGALEGTLRDVAEENRLAIPEYLLAKQYKMILAGDLEGILADYKSDDDKLAARKAFVKLEATQRYCREKTVGIRFVAKYQFGPWLRIRYVRVDKNPKAFSMPWAAYLQKYGSRYYFVQGPAADRIYNPVAEAWPYWEPQAKRGGDLLAGLDVMTILPPEATSADANAALRIYYKLEAFPPDTSLFGPEPTLSGQQLAIWRSIKKVIETYRTGDNKAILALWDAERRKIFEASPDMTEFSAVHEFWSEAKDASIDFLLDAGEYCWVYLVPKYEAKPGEQARKGKVKILSFHLVDGENYLTDVSRFDTPPRDTGPLFAEQILVTPEFRQGLVKAMNQ